MEPLSAFADAIAGAGLPVPADLIADGVLHRFATNGKDKSGWYVLHLDGIPTGVFGDWRTGLNEKWRAGLDRKLTADERKQFRRRMRAIQRQRDEVTQQRHAEAAMQAAEVIQGLQPAPASHPYFQKKGIHADVLVDADDLLVIPMTDPDGNVASLQFIDGSGDKRFLTGGRVVGCYFLIGMIGDTVIVAEGLATGASVHQATSHAVAVAFNAGNLRSVAELMRAKYPRIEIIIAADNDVREDDIENTGIVKAIEAAQTVGAGLAIPELDGKKCDFNDVHNAKGLECVAQQISSAQPAAAQNSGVPPMSETVDGAALLDDICTFIGRFCVFPDQHCLMAVSLWAACAHMIEYFHSTPRLAVVSPELGSGKTRVLEVLELLVPEPMLSLSASPAAVFRTLADRQITLLFDEADSIWSKRGKDGNHEDLRALLNAGYRRGATIPRCVGPRHEVQNFPVFCAAALAGIGELPDTIMSRSVIIRMKRRAPHEPIEPFRTRMHEAPGHKLRERLALWSGAIGRAAGEAWPELPVGIIDRPAECWEPLVAVADAAGGHWPKTARAACVELCRVALDRRVSLGVRLLADLRTIFGDADALHSESVLRRLHEGEEHGLDADAPWAELHGKPLAARGLASLLRPYGVKPVKVKADGRSLQGYRREALWDAWQRYLPPRSGKAEPPEPLDQSQQPCGFEADSNGSGQLLKTEPMEPPESRATTKPVPKVPEVPDIRTGESAPGQITETVEYI